MTSVITKKGSGKKALVMKKSEERSEYDRDDALAEHDRDPSFIKTKSGKTVMVMKKPKKRSEYDRGDELAEYDREVRKDSGKVKFEKISKAELERERQLRLQLGKSVRNLSRWKLEMHNPPTDWKDEVPDRFINPKPPLYKRAQAGAYAYQDPPYQQASAYSRRGESYPRSPPFPENSRNYDTRHVRTQDHRPAHHSRYQAEDDSRDRRENRRNYDTNRVPPRNQQPPRNPEYQSDNDPEDERGGYDERPENPHDNLNVKDDPNLDKGPEDFEEEPCDENEPRRNTRPSTIPDDRLQFPTSRKSRGQRRR